MRIHRGMEVMEGISCFPFQLYVESNAVELYTKNKGAANITLAGASFLGFF